ncbi:hypothetical protein [Burkholderia ambifaria]|uniref:hypothetical protein n=1 Tax=Burkholderia ambifaria TaxID=152480 RepID=UPI00158E877A|nr:hypothetical protein [Burkholderia ambifaria]MBR8176990.1 hypothetical protein [Burkholderia ambifaria]
MPPHNVSRRNADHGTMCSFQSKPLRDVCILADLMTESVNENPNMTESIILIGVIVSSVRPDQPGGARPVLAPCAHSDRVACRQYAHGGDEAVRVKARGRADLHGAISANR